MRDFSDLDKVVEQLHDEMRKRGINPNSPQGQMIMIYIAIKNRWIQKIANRLNAGR